MTEKMKAVMARTKNGHSMAARSLNSLQGCVRHLTDYMSFVEVCRLEESCCRDILQ